MALSRQNALVDRIERYLQISLDHPGLPINAPLGATIHQDVEAYMRLGRRLRPISGDLVEMGYVLRAQSHFLLAIFRRGERERQGSPLRVPVFTDARNADASAVVRGLERSGIDLITVPQREFIHQAALRAAEFATLASRGATAQTIVHTPQPGETVIYCKGYFLSTTAGFGTSTPAKSVIPPGQYCFGIMRPDGPRFQDLVWNCPTNLHLDLL
ncbi:hypothetical protein HMPREF0185_00442 [Brevundimonas diminuta 470-4]|nr:hypothetical protein HMPREF0185_00442 [Brevundimonas diminuta 470-4]